MTPWILKKRDNYKSSYEDLVNEPVELVDCQYFTTTKIKADEVMHFDYQDFDSFVIYICCKGSLEVVVNHEVTPLKKGEVLFLPAVLNEVTHIPHGEYELLQVVINDAIEYS